MRQAKHVCPISSHTQSSWVSPLESGNILYLEQGGFDLLQDEHVLLSETLLKKGKKNISYDIKTKKLQGVHPGLAPSLLQDKTQVMMDRYAKYAKTLVETLCPEYKDNLIWGRTSFRPAEVETRVTSKRKDDTKLHVDSFASMPVKGKRILRVFCNINPEDKPRVWNVGETFGHVLSRFGNSVPRYSKVWAKVMHKLAMTKNIRTEYDHIMLNLHDMMKLDNDYQQRVSKETLAFPSQATWMVFTDMVSHAALSGQYLLEQTFYLNVEDMDNPSQSPLYQIKASGQWGQELI